jgi:serine/threonine protein kinase
VSLEARQVQLETERFELRERLGEGGAGVVYEAFDREHERVVALKLLPEMGAADIGRLKHEFRSLADVVHPNLVRLHELVGSGAQWFFTMELLRGSSFLEFVRTPDAAPPADLGELETRRAQAVQAQETVRDVRGAGPAGRAFDPGRGRPRIAELRDALAQLAQGVCAIHAAGKLHCDLKPSNVLVTQEGRVVVLDFGLVTDAGALQRMPDEAVSGTPAYMAPEQAAGDPVSEASDWYAVGVMLYEALTGRLPYTGTPIEMMSQKQLSDPPPPDLLAPDLPADLCELCVALLARNPDERPRSAEILARIGRGRPSDHAAVHSSSVPPAHRATPLVGRAAELEQLEQAFAQVRRRQPVTVYVRGNAGIGKTRLLQEFLARTARTADTVVLAGRCYERERLPFKAFDSVVDALTAYLIRLGEPTAASLLPRDVHSMARLFPVLLRVPSIAQAPRPTFEVPDPHELRRRAFASIKELLARIADRAPLVVHIDDLHWGDVDSASLLLDLLAPPDPPAMLFVASFRSEDTVSSAFVRTLLSQHPAATEQTAARSIALEPLSADESLRLVHTFQGALPDAPEKARDQAEAIAREGAGNPFFVAQLVHYIASSQASTANTNAALGGRPVTLEQVLRERLSLLSPPALALLQTVCVAGHPIARDLAIEAADVGIQADSALSLLRAGAWLRLLGPRRDDVVECFHDRVRDVVAQTLPADALRACHARLALSLERSGRASPVDLAVHFRAAEQPGKAAHYAQRAAETASYALAFDDAARWYELALSLGGQGESAQGELRLKLGEALANAGRGAEAAKVYQHAADQAEPQFRLELQRRAAEQWLASGHIDEGVAALGSVLAAIDMRLAKTPRRALWSMLVQRARVKLRGLGWQRRAEHTVAPAQLMRIDTCWSVATKLATVDTIRAADFQARHLLLALEAGEPYRVARALAIEAGFAATSGGPNRARAEAIGATARQLAGELEHSHPHALGLSMMMIGMNAYLMGEWAAALRDCDAAERILLDRCTGVLWELTNTRRFALSSLVFMGRVAELGRRTPGLLADARERGNLYAETDLRTRLMTLSWLAQGKPELAAADADDALARWTQRGFHLQHYNHLLGVTQCDLYRGDAPAALARIDRTWPALSRSLLLRIQALRAEILHARGRAMLAALGHSRAASTAAIARIAGQLDDEQMAWTAPLAGLLRAGLHARDRQPEHCRSALEQAARGFDAADMGLHAAAARQRLGALVAGAEGAALCAQAAHFFEAQAIADPQAFTRMVAPGFD